MIEDGCYGGMMALLVGAAKASGIRVAEYQHSLVTGSHQAYNYGPAINGSDYQKFLPDDFLLWGEFWGEQVRLPCSRVIIGNPWLSDAVAARPSIPQTTGPERILVASAGLNPEDLSRFVRELSAALPGREIVLRIHPSERPTLIARYGALVAQGVRIDELDLYESIARSSLVTGDISSVLFEATAFGKKVSCRRSAQSDAMNPGEILQTVDSGEECARLSITDSLPLAEGPPPSPRLWADGWQANFRRYVERILPIIQPG
jgi:hypothetical protein